MGSVVENFSFVVIVSHML